MLKVPPAFAVATSGWTAPAAWPLLGLPVAPDELLPASFESPPQAVANAPARAAPPATPPSRARLPTRPPRPAALRCPAAMVRPSSALLHRRVSDHVVAGRARRAARPRTG